MTECFTETSRLMLLLRPFSGGRRWLQSKGSCHDTMTVISAGLLVFSMGTGGEEGDGESALRTSLQMTADSGDN